jgi:hypothetical protein
VSLSDIMSHIDLAVYPQVALVIFLGVFGGVSWRIFRKPNVSEFKRMAQLPLEEDMVVREGKRGECT